MALRIKLKNSVVQDRVPTTSDLPEVGELAVNANINSIGGFMRASDNSVVKIFGPGSLSTPTASTTVSGISELATNSETTTGTATDRVVTPAGLNAVTVAERTTSNTNYVAKAGSTLTGVLTMPNGSNSAPAINFGDSDSGIFGGTNTVSLAAGGTTRLTADTGVSVVGTLAVTGAITSTSDLTVAEKVIHAGDTDTFVSFPSANTVSVETGGNEALRVDSSGRLLVGVTSAQSISGTSVSMQNCGTAFADSSSLIGIFSADNVGSTLAFAKSRNATLGQQSALLDNDEIGKIRFYGSDGNDFANYAAEILAEIDGTPANNNMPGSLVFKTTASGATPTERLRIAANGTTTIAGNLDCSSGIDVTGAITGTGDLTIDTNTLHVDSSDNRVGIGTTSPTGKLSIASGTFQTTTPTSTGDDLVISGNQSLGIQFLTLASGTSNNNIYFGDTDDPDIGMIRYAHADNSMQFRTNTNLAMTIDSSGDVGIGTSDPTNQLHVHDNTAANDTPEIKIESFRPSMRLKDRSSGSASAEIVGDNGLIFRVSAPVDDNTALTQRMVIESSGNIVANFDGSSETGQFQIADGSASSPGLTFWADGSADTGIFRSGANTLGFSTGGSPRMLIDSSGNVGIDTTSPDSALHVYKQTNDRTARFQRISTQFIDIKQTSGINSFTSTGKNFEIGTADSNDLIFDTNDQPRMTIDSSGDVGIGTSSPNAKLEVAGSSVRIRSTANSSDGLLDFYGQNTSNGAIIRSFGSDGSAGHFHFRNANNSAMTIDSSGNVGIGTTSPNSRLNLNIGADQNWLQIDKSRAANEAMLQLIHSAGNRHAAIRYANADDAWKVGISGTEAFVFANGATTTGDGTTRLQITSSGVVEYAVNTKARFLRNTGGSNTQAVQFLSGATQVGQIIFNNSDTFYQTGSSDRTLKKNFENWTETILTSFKNLNPQKFNYIHELDADSKHKGYVAQDLADEFPEAYPKDPETDKYGFNPSGMVVYLMKAIQELEAKVAALEAT